MLDELYDDVLSILKEKGFVDWYSINHRGKISPLRWCYESEGNLKTPTQPIKGMKWLVFSHDEYMFLPYKLSINDEGVVEPTK